MKAKPSAQGKPQEGLDPKRLLYGKEEHANPALEPSALRDQIEDLIQANVKQECLKNPQG